MIYGIQLRSLRNAEYLQFQKDVLALMLSNNPATLGVQAQYASLQEQVVDLETLFKLSQASELTQELQDLDTRRDRCISGIRQVVEGYCNHFVPERAAAANLLKKNIDLYGSDIERQNYMAQTATLSGLVSDWENSASLNDAMTLLNLKEWKNEMKAANEDFNAKYLDRTQQYGAATDETLSSEKAETNELYYLLRDQLSAQNTVARTPERTKTINELNALIAQYNVLLRNREPLTENENPAP